MERGACYRLRIGLVSARRGSSASSCRSVVESIRVSRGSIETPTPTLSPIPRSADPGGSFLNADQLHQLTSLPFVPSWRTTCSTSTPSSSTSVSSLSQQQNFSVPPDLGSQRYHTDIRHSIARRVPHASACRLRLNRPARIDPTGGFCSSS